MIYAPKKFAFIHIPRTGGYSIKQAIASQIMALDGCVINTLPKNPGLWCHSTAAEMKRDIPDWDQIYKFALMRNPYHLVASMWNWSQRYEPGAHADFSAFIRRPNWPIPDGGFYRGYCGKEGVEIFQYERLNEIWPNICTRIGIPSTTLLPHLNGMGKLAEIQPDDAVVIRERCRLDFQLLACSDSPIVRLEQCGSVSKKD